MGYVEQSGHEGGAANLLRNAAALGLSLSQTGRLREAFRLEAAGRKADKRRAREIVAEVKRELMEAQGQTLAVEARHAADLGPLNLGDPRAVERRRRLEVEEGEQVSAFNDAGAVRLGSRDGFAHLRELGKISAFEFEIGLLYRCLYEDEGSDLRSQLGGEEGGAGFDRERFVIARYTRAKRVVLLETIENAVVAAASLPGRSRYGRGHAELKALRLVAGQGLPLQRLADGGAMRAVYLAALIRALEAAASVIRVRWAA